MRVYEMANKFVTLKKVIKIYGFIGVARIIFRLNLGPAKHSTFEDTLPSEKLYEEISRVLSFPKDRDFQSAYSKFCRAKDELFSLSPDRLYFTKEYDLGDCLLFALFLLITSKNELQILESGVAAGKSTTFILNQQNEVGQGTLHSIDITSKVGDLIPSHLKDRFNLHVLPQVNRKMKFREIVSDLTQIDIFLHDSDHSIEYQLFEIETVLRINLSIKWILIDDINIETVEYIKNNSNVKSLMILDEGHKYSAVARNFGPI